MLKVLLVVGASCSRYFLLELEIGTKSRMTSLVRTSEEVMLESINNFKSLFDLVSRASDKVDPFLPVSLSEFRRELDDQYIALSCDW